MEWKELKIDDCIYEISEYGDCRRKKQNGDYFYYKKTIQKDGYVSCGIKSSHVLCAMAFLNHIPNGHNIIVHHKDSNRQNNHYSNLELISQINNILNRNIEKTSMYDYVSFCNSTKRYKICMNAEGRVRYYGSFKNEDDAGKIANVLKEMYKL